MLNNCKFLGWLKYQPELRHTTSSGRSVTSFTISVSRDYRNPDGEWIYDYIDCVAWNKDAEEICEKYNKGDLLSITGRLQNRPYIDKDGVRIVVAEIVVESHEKVSASKRSSFPPSPPFPTEQSSSSVSDPVTPEDDTLSSK